MESTTNKLIAHAVSTTTVFKQLQLFFAAFFSYCSSLLDSYDKQFVAVFPFWCCELSQSRKHPLPVFYSDNFLKKIP